MVSRDPFSENRSRSADEPRIAPVFDRMLAFFIDFLIFAPIVSLAGSGALRDFRSLAMIDSTSPAAMLSWFSLLGGSLALCILAESLCLYRWGATPGQRFLQLRVKPWPVDERLSLLQCLARTTLWWISTPLLLPLLGIYTNPYRRAFHDRATDTMVVTEKRFGDPGPVDIEARFFRSWSQTFVLFLLFVAAGTLAEVHRLGRAGAFDVGGGDSPFCEDVGEDYVGVQRLDHAVAGFLAGSWKKECLEREADHALWNGTEAERPMANVAMGIALADEKQSATAYLSRACELSEKDEACGIAKFLQSEKSDRGDWLRRGGLSTETSRLLLARESIDRGQIPSAVSLIKDLRGVKDIGDWLKHQEVRAFWKLREQLGGRRPASTAKENAGSTREKKEPRENRVTNESQEMLEEFEARYDLR